MVQFRAFERRREEERRRGAVAKKDEADAARKRDEEVGYTDKMLGSNRYISRTDMMFVLRIWMDRIG